MFQVNTTITNDYTNFLVDVLFVKPTTTTTAATTTTTTTTSPATTMFINNTLNAPSINNSFVVEISNSSQIETVPVLVSSTTKQPEPSLTPKVTQQQQQQQQQTEQPNQQQLPLPGSFNNSNETISFQDSKINQNKFNYTNLDIIQELSTNTKKLIHLVYALLILVSFLILILIFVIVAQAFPHYKHRNKFKTMTDEEV